MELDGVPASPTELRALINNGRLPPLLAVPSALATLRPRLALRLLLLLLLLLRALLVFPSVLAFVLRLRRGVDPGILIANDDFWQVTFYSERYWTQYYNWSFVLTSPESMRSWGSHAQLILHQTNDDRWWLMSKYYFKDVGLLPSYF